MEIFKKFSYYIEETKEDKIKINIKKKRRNKKEYFDLHPEIALNDRNMQDKRKS